MGCDSDSTILNRIEEKVRKILQYPGVLPIIISLTAACSKQSHAEPHRTERLLTALAVFSFIDNLSKTGF